MTTRPSCPVLIVEDDESFRKPLTAALDAAHFTVTAASTATEALGALKERPFHVIILDLTLPDKSGLEVLDYIRRNRSAIDSKVIIVSGVDPRLRQSADFTSAEEVLLKPVDFNYVAERAKRYCSH